MVNNKQKKTKPTPILIYIVSTIKNTLVTMIDPQIPQMKPKVLLQTTSRGYPIKMKKKIMHIFYKKLVCK